MPEEDTGRDAERLGRRRSRIPPAVWLAVAINVLLMACYSVLVPSYRGPDEAFHVDLVLAMNGGFRYPDFGERVVSARTRASMKIVRYGQLQTPHLTGDEAGDRATRPTFADFGPDVAAFPVNHLTQHPPLYYWLASLVSDGATGGSGAQEAWPWDRVVALLRLMDVVLMSSLPLLAYLVARRLGYDENVGLSAAIFLLAIPELVHIGSVVNNDDLLTPLFGVLALLVVRVMTGDGSLRTAFLMGIVAGLALLTKGFALIFPLWFVLAYLVAYLARKDMGRLIAGRAVAAVGTAFVVGGWWWVRNVVMFGAVQPSLPDVTQVRKAPAGFEPSFTWWIQRYVGAMIERFFSWIGGYGGRLPLLVVIFAAAVVVGAIVAAFVNAHDWLSRARFAVLLIPVPAIAALVAGPAYAAYTRTATTPALQGRYLFPGVVGMAAVVAAGLASILRSRVRLLPILMLAGAAAMQGFALWRIMHSFWGPQGSSLSTLFRAALAWSPWPDAVVIVVGLLLLVAVVGLASVIVHQSLRGREPSGESA